MFYPNSLQHHYAYLQYRRKQRNQKKSGMLYSLLSGLWYSLVTLLAFCGFVALLAGVAMAYTGTLPLQPAGRHRLVRAAQGLGIPEKPFGSATTPLLGLSQMPVQGHPIIYLNREGGTLTAGPDDSASNISSVVAAAGLNEFTVPAFRSSPQRWDSIVDCVAERFEMYNVAIVDQRPIDSDYIMVMVGGEPDILASRTGHIPRRGSRITGLAPLARTPIPNAIVFAFSREIREQTRGVCESITHEVGHAFGLDHVMNCHDPMTHLASCGRRTFQDRETACGETEPRNCISESASQNSHRQLLELLGPNPEKNLNTQRAARGVTRQTTSGSRI